VFTLFLVLLVLAQQYLVPWMIPTVAAGP